ncbi:hypothetical protein [Bacillus wiedmannii]|uniref:hypothetical protein n=1 Tax=Bacillus wiedmannii TaxID=1890302 RepID=UPI000CD831D3|nr:hypothetical protein [Bacillus wiedmannii]MBG9832139.1 hypothetical protein [Bacillus wiedmannii]UOB95746.1 hypothetical protein BTI679_30890 [Bacillus wiedmannii]
MKRGYQEVPKKKQNTEENIIPEPSKDSAKLNPKVHSPRYIFINRLIGFVIIGVVLFGGYKVITGIIGAENDISDRKVITEQKHKEENADKELKELEDSYNKAKAEELEQQAADAKGMTVEEYRSWKAKERVSEQKANRESEKKSKEIMEELDKIQKESDRQQ